MRMLHILRINKDKNVHKCEVGEKKDNFCKKKTSKLNFKGTEGVKQSESVENCLIN